MSTNGGYTAGRGTSGAVVNGNPTDIGIYLFDGIQSVDADANVLIFYPPVDAIQEFVVQTSAAPASYGGGPTVINVTFRSGTNNYHGALYEFVRNSDFDAKNFFDSHANPIPPFHLNQFGANLGGPVSDTARIQRQGQAFLLRGLRGPAREPGADLHLNRADSGFPHGRFLGAAAEDSPAYSRDHHASAQ